MQSSAASRSCGAFARMARPGGRERRCTVTVRAWRPDRPSGDPLSRLEAAAGARPCLQPGRSLLATGGGDTLCFVERPAGLRAAARPAGHKDEIRSLAFTPDGASSQRQPGPGHPLWSRPRLDAAPVTITGVNEWIRAPAISPDGEMLAATDTQGRIRLLSPAQTRWRRDCEARGLAPHRPGVGRPPESDPGLPPPAAPPGIAGHVTRWRPSSGVSNNVATRYRMMESSKYLRCRAPRLHGEETS